MKQVLSVVLVLLTCCGRPAAGQTASSTDPWAGLRFLLGTWEAKTSGGGAGAQATGTYSFRLELKDHVMARHSMYSSCKGAEDFNCDHGDLLYIYAEAPGAGLRAIYFDTEGHVIHYAVTTPRTGTVVLESEASEPGPQFRLKYELKGEVMTGKFEIRMAGKGDFAPYLEWNGPKKGDDHR